MSVWYGRIAGRRQSQTDMALNGKAQCACLAPELNVCFVVAQIKELNLDNCRGPLIDGLTSEFVNLKSLSLINVGLTSLKGMPKLPNLKKLELSDNRISSGLNLLHASTKLTHLNLSGNRIQDVATLEPLKEFAALKYLDLFNNEVTAVDNYREKVFTLVPSLKFLDGFDKDDKEAEESEDEDQEEANDGSDDEEEGDDDFDDEEEDSDGGVGIGILARDNIDVSSCRSHLSLMCHCLNAGGRV